MIKNRALGFSASVTDSLWRKGVEDSGEMIKALIKLL
jgi:hypothetical protein